MKLDPKLRTQTLLGPVMRTILLLSILITANLGFTATKGDLNEEFGPPYRGALSKEEILTPNYIYNPMAGGFSRVNRIASPMFDSEVIGQITSIQRGVDGEVVVSGYTCQTYSDQEISYRVFVSGRRRYAGLTHRGVTNLPSNKKVLEECKSSPNKKHNFAFELSKDQAERYQNMPVYVIGISPTRTGHVLLEGSGQRIPAPSTGEEILGAVERVSHMASGVSIEGWSCHSKVNQAINVHVYSKGEYENKFLKSVPANIPHFRSDISQMCGTKNIPHRFRAFISNELLAQKNAQGDEVLVYGLALNSNARNKAITNNGQFHYPELIQRLSEISEEGEDITIEEGQTVLMDTAYDLGQVNVRGTLKCADYSSNIKLQTTGILVYGEGAKLECGTKESPFSGNFSIKLKEGKSLQFPGSNREVGEMAIMAMMGGEISLHGSFNTKTFGHLVANAKEGDSTISVNSDLAVATGDKIAIAPTSYKFDQAEERTVTDVTVQGSQIVLNLDRPLEYAHIGEVEKYNTPSGTKTLDMRANLAIINRNIKISPSSTELADETKIGGHIMIMRSSKGLLSSVQLDRMGQMGHMARYPFHWHLAGNVNGQYIENSSITNSYQRCVTIHGTNNARVTNNVCYNHFSHGFFLEDGNETDNIIEENIGILAKAPPKDRALLHSDHTSKQIVRFAAPSTFWISNPQNTVNNNVAAGYEGTGFWMAFSKSLYCESGKCAAPKNGEVTNYRPNRLETHSFANNKAYSGLIGFTWDGAPDGELTNNPNNETDRETISTHYFGYPGTQGYSPEFPNLEAFKNINSGIYYRGTTAVFENFTAADNGVSIFVAYNQKFINSLIVGESRSLTEEERDFQIRKSNWKHGLDGVRYYKKVKGFVTYDGPALLDNVHFAGFPENQIFNYGFDLTPSPIHIFGGSTHYEHQMQNISFEGNPFYKVNFNYDKNDGWMDERNHVRIRDLDGSISGYRNSLIVPNHPILDDERCSLGDYSSNTLICDYDLGVFWFRNSIGLDGKTQNRLNFRGVRSDGATYGPLEDSYRHNNKLGLITEGYNYTVSLDRSELLVVRFLYEHKELDAYSPIVRLENTASCNVFIQDTNESMYEARNVTELERVNRSAFLRHNNGDLRVKLKTQHLVPSGQSAYRSNSYELRCAQ